VLKALEPRGKIAPPEMKTEWDKWEPEPDAEFKSLFNAWADSFKSPEARGRAAAEYVLTSFIRIPQMTAEERDEFAKDELQRGTPPSSADEFYAMPQAARDLTIDPESNHIHDFTSFWRIRGTKGDDQT
jgi:hypothetical protein